jgi:ribosomal protein L16/L10AE
VPEIIVKAAMRIAAYKIPIRIHFIIVISNKNMSDE